MASEFKDIEQFRGTAMPLMNVVLSHNPCPSCKEANGQVMTFDEWEASPYGLPGTSGRYCEDDCHCILVPEGMLEDLPGLWEQVKLRGDKDTDVGSVVDIGPMEEAFTEIFEEWYALGNQSLPRELYDMAMDEIVPYLRRLITAQRGGV